MTSKEGKDDTLLKAIEVLKQNKSNLNHNSSIEEVEAYENLKRQLFHALFEPTDEMIRNTPAIRNKITEVLFDKVYTSATLDKITVQQIGEIRNEKNTYETHERKVIVNALALSLLTFNKFDYLKANLLLDFVSDYENTVWQTALVGLVLALLYNQNKWQRFDTLKARLNVLQQLSHVQEGLRSIDLILRRRFFEKTKLQYNIFRLPFFKSPINCFLPYYKNNPVYKDALDNNPGDIDSELFEHTISSPLLDSEKYAISLAVREGTAQTVKQSKAEVKKTIEIFNLAAYLSPYQNIVGEFYNFLTLYPSHKLEDVFVKQMMITQTKLKGIILDRSNQLLMTAENSMDVHSYSSAIPTLLDLLKLEPENEIALMDIAICHLNLKTPEYESALKSLLSLYKLNSNNPKTTTMIAECYSKTERNELALEFFEKTRTINPNYLPFIDKLADHFDRNKNYIEEITLLEGATKLYPKHFGLGTALLCAYESRQKSGIGEKEISEISAKSLNKLFELLEISSEEDLYIVYFHLSKTYCTIFEFENAVKYAMLGYKSKGRALDLIMNLGRTYLLEGKQLDKARQYLNKCRSLVKKDPIVFGNLGHLELVSGNIDKAIDHYKECVVLFKHLEDFSIKFNWDKRHLSYLGVKKDVYDDIERLIIDHYNSHRL